MRDPRIDPQPGDVLEMRCEGSCWFRHVITRSPRGHVRFAARCGNQWFNATMSDTLDDWRTATRDAFVVQTAEGAAGYAE